MSRLVLITVLVAIVFLALRGGLRLVRRAAAVPGDAMAQFQPGGLAMRNCAHLVLIALILYVSFWGGG